MPSSTRRTAGASRFGSRRANEVCGSPSGTRGSGSSQESNTGSSASSTASTPSRAAASAGPASASTSAASSSAGCRDGSRWSRARERARPSSSTCPSLRPRQPRSRRRYPKPRSSLGLVAAGIRIGTCSWADESLTRYFYPRSVKGAEERLRYYADRFDTVEANSTYYHLPAREMVERWAERTPEGFVMHVKAFGVMTRHPVKVEQLPTDLRDEAPLDHRGRVDRPPREFRAEVFRRFHEALEPLRETGKLGGILMQFPPYVVPRPAAFDYLEWAQQQLGGDEMLVEFRHGSWLDDEHCEETLAFLERQGMTYVIVDAPRTGGANVLPTVVETTSPTAYVRFHGRNAA